jgi:RNA polymerase sigma factor (TIGR02999 family)
MHKNKLNADNAVPFILPFLDDTNLQKMAQEAPGQTLQATALVHEVYLRLVEVEKAPHWNSRGHFFAAAAEAMRRILVEQARRKQRHKHGGGRQRTDLNEALLVHNAPDEQLLEIHDALDQLAKEDPQAAELVKLRFFAGFSVEEAADALGLPRSTAYVHWAYAKASLRVLLALDANALPS